MARTALDYISAPVTRQKYIDFIYAKGDRPDPWTAEDEADLPEKLQDWSQTFILDFNPHHEPAGSPIGGQFASGQSISFISPNIGNLNFEQAREEVESERQKKYLEAAKRVDAELGIVGGDNRSVIGAWSDGAENSTISIMPGTDFEHGRVAAAMKGYLADQKAVVVFEPKLDGTDFMVNFKATGDLADIHDHLLQSGVAFHSLEPDSDGAIVHIFGKGQADVDAIEKAAAKYKADVDFVSGIGDFVGTTKESGTDREQRDDARRVYQAIIAEAASKFPQQNIGSAWDRLRADRGLETKALTKLLGRDFNPNHVRSGPDGGQFTFAPEGLGGGGSSSKKITLKTVNKELAKIGAAEELVKGNGYYYFTGGNSHHWPATSVYVYRLNQLTLEQWISHYRDLAGDDSAVQHSRHSYHRDFNPNHEPAGSSIGGQFAHAPGGAGTKIDIAKDMTRDPEPGTDRQPVKTLDELYEKSRTAEKDFDDDIKEIAKATGGIARFTQPDDSDAGSKLKRRSSAERKMRDEYNGDPTQLRDIMRATVVHETVADTRKAAAKFIEEKGDDIIRVKDRFIERNGGDGYRDVMLNYRTDSGLIAEVQFNTSKMIAAKHVGHEYYEEARLITPKLLQQDDAQLRFRVGELTKLMANLYEDAYQNSGDHKGW